MLAGSLLLFITSCKLYQVNPPYTDTEKIIGLKAGMTYNEATQLLGIPPYDILNIQEEGGSIITYNYRLKDRRVKMPPSRKKQQELIHSESYQKAGEVWYKDESNKLYVFFKDGKLKSMITDKGIEDAEFLMVMNNNIKFLAKEDFHKMKTYRIGAGNTYLINKDSTAVIYQVPGKDTKPNAINTALQSGKTKAGKIILWSAVGVFGLFLLVSALN